MQLDEPNATIVLDTRRAITSGEHKGKYPVKLRVTFQVLKEGKTSWLQKYYATGFYLDETEYRNAISEKPTRALRDASDAFVDAKAKAKKIIKDFPSINADLFTLYYTGKAIRSAEVDKLFSLHIENFRSNGQIKSADSYESTRQSLTKFSPGNLVLNVIDKDFLDRYEKWMLSNGFSKGKSDNRNKRGTSIATIGIYMRNLRAVFNYAIRQKIVSQDIYPFGKHGYRIPEGDSIKKALNADERDLYFKYVPENEYQERALDFWKLSYYLNGVNPIDIAYLTEANIQGDVLYYVRSKTKNTERVQSVMAVPLRQEVKDIIAKWGIYKPYLFGIITPEMDALKKRRTVEDFVKRTNKQLNIIRKKLGLGKITTYTARHTAATTYLRLGADLKTIQEFLGHSSISTTEAYLKSIDMEGKKKLNQLL